MTWSSKRSRPASRWNPKRSRPSRYWIQKRSGRKPYRSRGRRRHVPYRDYCAGRLRRSLLNARDQARRSSRIAGAARAARSKAEASLRKTRRKLYDLRAAVRAWMSEVEGWGETRLQARMERALGR